MSVTLDNDLIATDETNYGPYITTVRGNKFYFENPGQSDISLKDIADALSKINRFSGHTTVPWSVAEHLLVGSYLIDPPYAFDFLCHDIVEAYIGDVSRPFKSLLPDYQRIENAAQKALASRLGFTYPFVPEVKEMDNYLVATEAMAYAGQPEWAQNLPHMPADKFREYCMAKHISGSPAGIAGHFLTRFGKLAATYLVCPVCHIRHNYEPGKLEDGQGNVLSTWKTCTIRNASFDKVEQEALVA